MPDTSDSTPGQALGWQGFFLEPPAGWHLAQFRGSHSEGSLRVDDGDGPRLELRWESPLKTIDLERSIAGFVERLAKQAKKKKQPFQAADHPAIVAKSRKPNLPLVNFGWTGDACDELAAHGWGTAWQCGVCGRVVVAHLIGRGREKPRQAQQLAGELFGSMTCHGRGGWGRWSVFGLKVDTPEAFSFARANLQTGRLEIEWRRAPQPGLTGWKSRPERLVLRRFAAANVLLDGDTLADWLPRHLPKSKSTQFSNLEEISGPGEDAVLMTGRPGSAGQRLFLAGRARLLRRPPGQIQLRCWLDAEQNKILSLESELLPENAHVQGDVLESVSSD